MSLGKPHGELNEFIGFARGVQVAVVNDRPEIGAAAAPLTINILVSNPPYTRQKQNKTIQIHYYYYKVRQVLCLISASRELLIKDYRILGLDIE